MRQDDSSSGWRLEKQLDQICDSFETELRAGKHPRISDYLDRAEDSAQEVLLEQLLPLELEYRDENAIPWTLDDYLEQLSIHLKLVKHIIGQYRDSLASKNSASAGRDTDAVALPEDDTDPTFPVSLVPGTTIGQYTLQQQIGSGGMGDVFRARQSGTDRPVALKFLNAIKGTASKRASVIERFLQEPKAAAKLVHENIVTVYEVSDVDGLPFFSMQLIDGPSLRELTRDKPLDCRKAASYVKDIARAIEHAHKHHILHRDIKPGNILVGTDERPYITDFGMAKSLAHDLELTQDGIGMGTVGYVSPEQAESAASATARSDVYGLGATLYCLLTCRPPFQADDLQETLRQVREVQPTRPRELNRDIDRDLETICLKCLAKHPLDRYESADELARDLDRYLNGEPIVARPIGSLRRIWRWGGRHRLVATLSLVLAGLVIVVAVVGPITALYTRSLTEQRESLTWQDSLKSAGLSSQRGQWQDALDMLQQAVEQGHPDRIEIQIKQIRALQALGRGNESRAILEELRARTDLGEHEPDVLLLVGQEQLKQGKTDEGLETIRLALSRGLKEAGDAYAQGLLATDSPTALEHFKAAIEFDPFHHDAHGALVFCQILLGQHDEAAAAAAAMTHLYPDDPSFHIALAWIAAIHGDTEAASAQLDEITGKLDETTVSELRAMCETLAKLDAMVARWDDPNQPKLATELVNLAQSLLRISGTSTLQLPPSLWPDVGDLTMLNLQLRIAPSFAEKRIERALEIHPEGTLYFALGQLHVRHATPNEEQLSAARDAFLAASRTLAMLPSINREALYALGMTEAGFAYAGKPQELANAMKHLRQYRQSGPFPNHRLQTVFGAALGAKDWDFAQLLLLDMDEQNHADKATRQWYRAYVAAEQGELQRAIGILEKAISEFPENELLRQRLEQFQNQVTQSVAD